MKNRLLYSDWFNDNYKDDKEFLADNADLIMHNCGYESEDEITESDIQEEFYHINSMNYDETKDYLFAHDKKVRNSCPYLILATIGRWDGNYAGGKIVGTFEQVWNSILDGSYDDIKIEIEDNDLCFVGYHHDGRDYFRVYQLTRKGENYCDNHYYDSDREIHSHLMNTKWYVRKMFSANYSLDRFDW